MLNKLSTRKLEKLENQCDKFNEKFPIGTPVTVRRDFDTKLTPTKTRSAAFVLSSHTAVIFLDGISGCYLLDRVAPMEGQK